MTRSEVLLVDMMGDEVVSQILPGRLTLTDNTQYWVWYQQHQQPKVMELEPLKSLLFSG